jgi:hypothetical protein
MDKQKQWWAPIWKGLVMDPEARHYARMKNAVWLFLYLVLNADRSSGILSRRVNTISTHTGIGRDTVMRWLAILRSAGYIASESNGRCLKIEILKWRARETGKTQAQKSEISNSRVGKYPTSWKPPDGQLKANESHQSHGSTAANDISIKRALFKIDRLDNKFFKNPMEYKPENQNELLAADLALALDDLPNLLLYLAYAKKYPESLLRKVLGEVKEVPVNKIKRSRGALFNHLVQKYAKQDN